MRVSKVIFGFFVVLMLLSNSFAALSQRKLSIIERDSLPTTLSNYLSDSQSKYFQDPISPQFVLIDRDAKMLFSLGGYVNGLGYAETSLSSTRGGVKNEGMGIDVGHSRVFLKYLGRFNNNKVEAYIETDFSGKGGTPRLRQGYIEFNNLKMGQGWSTFMDPESPKTINVNGPLSLSNRLSPQIRYRLPLSEKMWVSAAVEFPSGISALVPSGGGNQRVIDPIPYVYPDIPLAFNLDLERCHLFLSGSLRLLNYPSFETFFQNKFTFAAMASGNFDIIKRKNYSHKLYIQGVYTLGMADYLHELSGMGMNIIVSNNLLSLNIMPAFGCMGGYEFEWGKNSVNLVYSRVQVLDIMPVGMGLYRSGESITLNYIREVFKRGKVGAEVIALRRTNTADAINYNINLNLMVKYDF